MPNLDSSTLGLERANRAQWTQRTMVDHSQIKAGDSLNRARMRPAAGAARRLQSELYMYPKLSAMIRDSVGTMVSDHSAMSTT